MPAQPKEFLPDGDSVISEVTHDTSAAPLHTALCWGIDLTATLQSSQKSAGSFVSQPLTLRAVFDTIHNPYLLPRIRGVDLVWLRCGHVRN